MLIKLMKIKMCFLIHKGYISKFEHKRILAYIKSPLDRIPYKLFEVRKRDNTNGKDIFDSKADLNKLFSFVKKTPIIPPNDTSNTIDDQPARQRRRRNNNNTNSNPLESFRHEILDAVHASAENTNNSLQAINKKINNNNLLIKNNNNLSSTSSSLPSPSKHTISAMNEDKNRGAQRFDNEYLVHSGNNKSFSLIHNSIVKEVMNDENDHQWEKLLNDTNKNSVVNIQGK